MKTYVLLIHNTVAHYIVNHLIIDLCLAAERQPGERVSRQWWEKYGIYLVLGEGRTADKVMEAGREASAEIEAEDRILGGGGVRGKKIWVNESYRVM